MAKLRSKQLIETLHRKYEFGWTHADVQQFLATDYGIVVSLRTLIRWKKCLAVPNWQGNRVPCPPIHRKVTYDVAKRICTFRLLTGWGSYPLRLLLKYELSESTYKRVIRTAGLSRGSPIENKRIHWVKWQREHSNSLWQIDSFQLLDGSWITCVLDDCSRYCLGIRKNVALSTIVVTKLLEKIIARCGAPREILSDNGAEHGSTSKQSKFDHWCAKHDIKHIRSRIHKPTTAGKVERFQQTVQREMPYCNNDIELFRYRYNHIRPHMSLQGKRPAEVYFDQQQWLRTPEQKSRTWWE